LKERAERALRLGLIDSEEYVGAVLSLEPLIDTITDPDERVRKGVAQTLSVRESQAAVSLLNKLIGDESEEVRLYAAEALDLIDARYNERINELVQKIKDNPTSVENHESLGRIYSDFALLKENTPVIRNYYLEQALHEFETTIVLGGERTEILFVQAFILQMLGDLERAFSLYEKVISMDPKHREARFQKALIHYQRGEYSQVREECRFLSSLELEEEMKEVVLFWTEGEEG